MALVITTALATASDTAATAAVDDAYVTALGASSVLQIRTGASTNGPGGAVSGTLLASVTIASWTAATPSAGQITGSDPAAVTIAASGAAGHFRLQTSGGTAVMEGTVGTSAADLILDDVDLIEGGSLNLGVPVITIPVDAPTS